MRKKDLEATCQEKLSIELMNEEDTTTLYAVSELEERLNIALAKLPENVRHTFSNESF